MARIRHDVVLLKHLNEIGYFSTGQYKASNDFLEAQGWTNTEVRKIITDLCDDGLIETSDPGFLGFLYDLDPGGKPMLYQASGQPAFLAITPRGERYLDGIEERNVHLKLAGKNLVVFWIIFVCVVLGTIFSLWQGLLSAKQAGCWPFNQ